MKITNNLNEMINALNEHLKNPVEVFSSYYISPENGTKVFLSGGKPFLFTLNKPDNAKDANYFPLNEDETTTYVYRNYSGILLCLIPKKYLLSIEKTFKHLRRDIFEAFGSMYPITRETNPYRANSSYYYCYVVDGNKINVVADPYRSVLILNYFGGSCKLCNDTKNTFEIVAQTILNSITLTDNVSQIQ